MTKYIDADKLKTQLTKAEWLYKDDLFVAYGTVALMPAADVVEARHGRWETEVRTIYGHKIPFFACSVCGNSAVDEYNYCPHCGAKMDEEEQE